ncbi:MAG: MFS transporter [Bacteroidetes bacterium]|nr:MFS transporter [Bacteroidota bacterium]
MKTTTNRQNPKEEKKSFSQVLKDSFKELKETSIAFVKAPKALWGVNVPYVLEGLVYFGVLTILGKYSSENINLNDAQAGLVYSFLTGGITFAMLVLGGLSDKLGVRKSLIISFLVLILGRLLVAVSGSFGMQSGLWSPMFITMTTGLFFVMIAYGLYQPAAYAAVKRYTTPKTAAMGYAAIYGFMNLGAFFSGFISSLTRPHFIDTFPPNGLTSVFWVYVMITFIALVLTLMLITKKSDKDAVDVVKAAGNEGEEKEEDKSKEKINNTKLFVFGILMVASFLLSGFGIKNPINFIFSFSLLGLSITIDFFFTIAIILFAITIFEYLRRRPYHPFRDKRFTFFIFVLIPVQTLFAHNWLTLPYYLDRAFQGSVVSEYFEIFSNLNPILVFLFAPIVAGLTAKADVYKMMIYGTFVMAIPTFLLVLGPNMYLFLLYILIMTIGESMWQPRFLQWIAEVAPKGMVGLYMGVGQFPWFLTKVLTGFYSGWFLMKYVPLGVSPAEMSTETMWFFYGLIAIISPIGLVLAKKWVMKDFKVKAEV